MSGVRPARACSAVLWAAFLLVPSLPAGCGGEPTEAVVIYSSVDEPFAREVFAAFEKQTGIRVHFQPDTEAAKTTGLVHKLIQEKGRPRADVWWSSEAFGTQQLAAEGVLAAFEPATAADLPAAHRPAGRLWTAFAARPRVLVFNTNLVARADAPRSIHELTAAPWAGRLTMANPLFGTTRGWAAAIVAKLGEADGKQLLGDLRAACPVIAAGNSDVCRIVAGAADEDDVVLGLTDADDVWVRRGQGAPLDFLFLDQDEGQMGTLLIPNTVALVAGGPNPDNARKAVAFLCSAKVERMLAESRSRNVPLRPAVAAEYPDLAAPRPMEVDPGEVARHYVDLAGFLEETFAR